MVVPGPNGATMQRDFAFHACLDSETSQADVMALCGINQLLDAALAGYHVTLFAYGQTGGPQFMNVTSLARELLGIACYHVSIICNESHRVPSHKQLSTSAQGLAKHSLCQARKMS